MAKPVGKAKLCYCKVCKKKTRHVKALFSMPFDCASPHPDDNVCCATCQRPFSEEVKKKAALLGATVRYCHLCTDLPIDVADWLRFCVRKIAIRRYGK